MADNNQIIIYQSKERGVEIKVHLDNDTVWLTQVQMASLFDKDRKTISEHIRNVYKEGELEKKQLSGNSR